MPEMQAIPQSEGINYILFNILHYFILDIPDEIFSGSRPIEYLNVMLFHWLRPLNTSDISSTEHLSNS